jgi:Amt family ammonium transporter
MTLMGAGLLWVGWFGFNAGSSVNSGLDTARALTVTQVAAASGAVAWMVIEAFHHRKATSLGLASGILAGLVVITPAAGVVQVDGAIALGCIASVISYLAIMMKSKLGYDDTLDVFGIHGVSGMTGAVALTFFIRPAWMQEARQAAGGVWTLWQQLGVQSTAVLVTVVYSCAVSILLLWMIQKTVGFRLDTAHEMSGMDHSLHGEHGYGLLNPN